MTKARDLVDKIIEAENDFKKSQFISPVIPGVNIRIRIHGLIHELAVNNREYRGWAILQATDDKTARVVSEPEIDVIKKYLKLFPRLRMMVIGKPDEYVAMPVDIGNKLGITCSNLVYLCDDEPQQFDYIIARYDGLFWYDDIDMGRDPMIAEDMRQALDKNVSTSSLSIKGMSNVDKMVYDFAYQLKAEKQKKIIEERRKKLLQNKEASIHDSVEFSGGAIKRIDEMDDRYHIEWTLDGHEQKSIEVSKKNLRVFSVGVCIEDAGATFDLKSLVSAVKSRKQLMELEDAYTDGYAWHVGDEKAKRREHGLK